MITDARAAENRTPRFPRTRASMSPSGETVGAGGRASGTVPHRWLPDQVGRIVGARGLLIAFRLASLICAVVVAIGTLLPSNFKSNFDPIVDENMIEDAVVALSYASPFILTGCFLWMAVKLKTTLKITWYSLVIFTLSLSVVVVLFVSQNFYLLINNWAIDFLTYLDMNHALAYAVLSVIVMIGWRDRVNFSVLAFNLIAFGTALELSQEYIPGRSFQLADLVSNSLGVFVGLAGVGLVSLLRRDRRQTLPIA